MQLLMPYFGICLPTPYLRPWRLDALSPALHPIRDPGAQILASVLVTSLY